MEPAALHPGLGEHLAQRRPVAGDRADLIIHLIRNTFPPTSRKYWDEIKRDLQPIYTFAITFADRFPARDTY